MTMMFCAISNRGKEIEAPRVGELKKCGRKNMEVIVWKKIEKARN